MQLVVADTGPINYLILIGHIEVLPMLFERVILPSAVRDELMHQGAPSAVRNWIDNPPAWIEVKQGPRSSPTESNALDVGEEEAIALAIEIHADMILMDDREGVELARGKGIQVTGTLGVLFMAAEQGLLNLAAAFERIKLTNFRYRQEVMEQLLASISNAP